MFKPGDRVREKDNPEQVYTVISPQPEWSDSNAIWTEFTNSKGRRIVGVPFDEYELEKVEA